MNASVNRRRIYAALGVPEIWRYRNNKLQAFILDRDNCVYVESDRSFSFPILDLEIIPTFLEQSLQIGEISAVKAFRRSIREKISVVTSLTTNLRHYPEINTGFIQKLQGG